MNVWERDVERSLRSIRKIEKLVDDNGKLAMKQLGKVHVELSGIHEEVKDMNKSLSSLVTMNKSLSSLVTVLGKVNGTLREAHKLDSAEPEPPAE